MSRNTNAWSFPLDLKNDIELSNISVNEPPEITSDGIVFHVVMIIVLMVLQKNYLNDGRLMLIMEL